MDHHPKYLLSPDTILVPAPEFVLIPIEEGYILDGGRQPELLSGPIALSILPVILPQIDGTRSIAQITDASPAILRETLEEAIGQLISWGVLCLQEDLTARSPQMGNTLSSLKRGDSGACLEAASRVLATTEISIICDELTCEFAKETAEALRQNGFCHVHLRPPNASSNDSLVISLVNEETSPSLLEAHYIQVLSTGCRWLRASLDGYSAEIGPIFTADTTLCLRCLSGAKFGEVLTKLRLCKMDQVAWLAVLASEVTALLLSPIHASRAFRRYRLPFFESEVRTWPTTGLCLCNHARSADRELSVEVPLVETSRNIEYLPLLYEESIASRQEISNVGASSTVVPPTITKMMLSSASICLPTIRLDLPQHVLSLLLSTQKERTSPPTLQTVTQLLSLSVGIKYIAENTIRRWAPSGGNMGSIEAYLIAIDVEGLTPGVYFYKAEEHALKKLNRQSMDHLERTCATVHLGESVAAIIVFTGAYYRIARKYGPFAYKLSHLDGGSASSQLFLVASALEVKVRSVQSWDTEALGEALALRPQEDVPIQLFCLNSRQGAQAIDQRRSVGVTTDSLSLQSKVLSNLIDPSSEQLMEQFSNLQRVVQNRLPARIAPNNPFSIKHFCDVAFAATRSKVSLGGALNQRSSRRSFSDKEIDVQSLSLLLRSALDNNVFRGSRLSVTVLVQRSDGLSPGIYRLKSETLSLERKGEVFTREQIEELFLTRAYGDTPLIVWISGEIRPAMGLQQNHGEYQTLLVRAGLLAHRLWMAALGLELEGTVVAGIRSAAASRRHQFMEHGEVGLIAFICGYAPQEKAPDAGEA